MEFGTNKHLFSHLIILVGVILQQGCSIHSGNVSFSFQPDAQLSAALQDYTVNQGDPCPERFLSPDIQQAWLRDDKTMLF